ncbi:hypothetical protein WUBG_19012 [Wuchereria bancrofti]|uniref:Uncharacterized protein n=1 Tax=Wuchereria bancrofti TaxID=6293 RepID=J9DKV0_WUCBA|nr:hypothetical protein WUBG_19012 [Wuchereria bancrofti]
MLRNANASFMLGTTNWREQFTDALTVHAGFEDNENVNSKFSAFFDSNLTLFEFSQTWLS